MSTITTNPVQDSATTEIAATLNQMLAESYALMAQTHLAHWNVEGPNFYQLHEAFEEQYKDLFEAIDELAERVRALDHYSVGGLKTFAQMTNVPEGPSGASCPARDWISSLVVGHEKVLEHAFKARELAAEQGDAETEDLIIGRIATHQKFLWMLKSNLK